MQFRAEVCRPSWRERSLGGAAKSSTHRHRCWVYSVPRESEGADSKLHGPHRKGASKTAKPEAQLADHGNGPHAINANTTLDQKSSGFCQASEKQPWPDHPHAIAERLFDCGGMPAPNLQSSSPRLGTCGPQSEMESNVGMVLFAMNECSMVPQVWHLLPQQQRDGWVSSMGSSSCAPPECFICHDLEVLAAIAGLNSMQIAL